MWETKAQEYNKIYKTEKQETFGYERKINTPSLLNLCSTNAKTVLDLGCGNGTFTKQLVKKFPAVVAADSSDEMLTLTKKLLPEVQIVNIDVEKPFKLAQKFDLIVIKLVLMYVKDLENVARECSKAVKINKHVVISVTHPIRWYTWYLERFYEIREREGFGNMKKGYFSEVVIKRPIAGNKNLNFKFLHRTFKTYCNVFRKYNLFVDEVDEPKLSKRFIKENPNYVDLIGVPLRLNIRFIKRLQRKS